MLRFILTRKVIVNGYRSDKGASNTNSLAAGEELAEMESFNVCFEMNLNEFVSRCREIGGPVSTMTRVGSSSLWESCLTNRHSICTVNGLALSGKSCVDKIVAVSFPEEDWEVDLEVEDRVADMIL